MAFYMTKTLAVLVVGFLLMGYMQIGNAQIQSPAPSPVNDGTTLDQGIAYVLMVAALLITYLVH